MILTILLLVCAAFAGARLVPDGAVDGAAADRLFSGRRYAIVIGPPAFADAGFTALRYPADDARALATVLADPARGRFDRVWTLDTPEETRLASVRAAMDEVSAAARSPDDTVVLYFSTHGTLAPDGRGRLGQFVVLSDTRLAAVPGTALARDEIVSWLDRLPSRRKLLILATCHSGKGKSIHSPSVVEQLASTKGALPPLLAVSEASVMVGACAFDETARESERLGHDIYTAWLLEGLEKGDIDGDGAVTALEAHAWARDRTYSFTEGAQRPYALAEVTGRDPIVLTGRPGRADAGTVGSWTAAWAGYRIRVDGAAKGELPGVVPLDPGAHRVEILHPDDERVVLSRDVRVTAGGAVDLDALVRRDHMRFGIGGGSLFASPDGSGGGAFFGEVHLPRLLGHGWEVVAHGGAVLRWPSPSLEGGITVERVILPGAWQLRVGGDLQGFILGSSETGLLVPSLVPAPVVSVAFLPSGLYFARLAVSAGPLWYADRGALHGGGYARVALVTGIGG